MGCILRPKLIALDFRKRTRERMGTLGENHICFRKSLSQTFNLIRLDFSLISPRFAFFCCFVAHNRQSGTHTNGLKARLEAPDSKTLPNLRVYAHTCRQTNFWKRYRTWHTSTKTQHGFTSHLGQQLIFYFDIFIEFILYAFSKFFQVDHFFLDGDFFLVVPAPVPVLYSQHWK